jgi:hypothetical protein
MTDLLAHPVVRGALAGLLAAAAVDLGAFRAWKTWQEAATYHWGTASFRWVQGACIGALTGLGFGAWA